MAAFLVTDPLDPPLVVVGHPPRPGLGVGGTQSDALPGASLARRRALLGASAVGQDLELESRVIRLTSQAGVYSVHALTSQIPGVTRLVHDTLIVEQQVAQIRAATKDDRKRRSTNRRTFQHPPQGCEQRHGAHPEQRKGERPQWLPVEELVQCIW